MEKIKQDRAAMSTGMQMVHDHMDKAGVIGHWELLAAHIDIECKKYESTLLKIRQQLIGKGWLPFFDELIVEELGRPLATPSDLR